MVILLIHDSCARRHSSRAYRNHRRIRRQPKTPFTCQHFRIHRKVGQQALGDCSGPVDPMISVNSRQNEAPTYGPGCTGQEDQEATPSLGIKPASVSAQSVDRHSINNVGAVITDSERALLINIPCSGACVHGPHPPTLLHTVWHPDGRAQAEPSSGSRVKVTSTEGCVGEGRSNGMGSVLPSTQSPPRTQKVPELWAMRRGRTQADERGEQKPRALILRLQLV